MGFAMPPKWESTLPTAGWLKTFWPLIVFFLGLAVTWGVFSNRLEVLETNYKKIETRVEANEKEVAKDLEEVKVSLATIAECTKYWEKDVTGIKSELVRIRELLDSHY